MYSVKFPLVFTKLGQTQVQSQEVVIRIKIYHVNDDYGFNQQTITLPQASIVQNSELLVGYVLRHVNLCSLFGFMAYQTL